MECTNGLKGQQTDCAPIPLQTKEAVSIVEAAINHQKTHSVSPTHLTSIPSLPEVLTSHTSQNAAPLPAPNGLDLRNDPGQQSAGALQFDNDDSCEITLSLSDESFPRVTTKEVIAKTGVPKQFPAVLNCSWEDEALPSDGHRMGWLCQCNEIHPPSSINARSGQMRRVRSEKIFTKQKPINRERLVTNNTLPLHCCYIVKQKIGQGSWGSVHMAVERQSGLERAVKKVPKRFTSELFRFRQEISLLKSLDHPNIVRLYETFEDYANIYMVMEQCTGGELFDRLASVKYFDEATAATLVRQILSSICYCHSKGIAHRDLKPENFLFLSKDNNSPMKLIDFGLAKRYSTKRKLRTKVGTLYYVSPEVLMGLYDEKCDIWSCGVMMYLLLSGNPPFNGLTDSAILNQVNNATLKYDSPIWQHVSPEAKALTQMLLCRNSEARPSAEVALQHDWFKKFIPSPFGFLMLPRPLSVPQMLSSSITAGNSPAASRCDIGASYNSQSLLVGNLATKLVPKWRRFAQHNQLKRAALAVIAHHINDAKDLAGIRQTFLALDSTGDGVISEEELVSGFRAIHNYKRQMRTSECAPCRRAFRSTSLHSNLSHESLMSARDDSAIAPHRKMFMGAQFSTQFKPTDQKGKNLRAKDRSNSLTEVNASGQRCEGAVSVTSPLILPQRLQAASTGSHTHQGSGRVTICGTCGGYIKVKQKGDNFPVVTKRTALGNFCGDNQIPRPSHLQSITNNQRSSLTPFESRHRSGGSIASMSPCVSMHCSPSKSHEGEMYLEDTPRSARDRLAHDDPCSTLKGTDLSLDEKSTDHKMVECNICGHMDVSKNLVSSQSVEVELVVNRDALHRDSHYSSLDGEGAMIHSPTESSFVECEGDILEFISECNDDNEEYGFYADFEGPGVHTSENSFLSVTFGQIASALVRNVDLYGTSPITYSEFLAASLDRTQYIQEPFCKAAFRVFDRDGDGKICKSELRAALGWDSGPSGSIYGDEADDIATTESELNELMKLADADGDGVICFDDFMQFMKSDAASTRYLEIPGKDGKPCDRDDAGDSTHAGASLASLDGSRDRPNDRRGSVDDEPRRTPRTHQAETEVSLTGDDPYCGSYKAIRIPEPPMGLHSGEIDEASVDFFGM